GFGAIVFVSTNPDFIDQAKLEAGLSVIQATKGYPNMSAPWLAKALGGDFLFGFISAVAFATILAVVSGLTLAGASAISHDLYANVFARGRADEAHEIRVSRIATVALGIFAILIGVLAQSINVAFAVGLAFAIAASCNFPVLLMSMFWKDMTTRGAVVGGFLGLITAFLGVVLSPAVWEGIFGNPKGSALVTIDNPTLFSMSLAFVAIYVVSKVDSSKRASTDRAGFLAQFVRSQTGLGAEGAAAH
ncbi:MAG: cation acetate symporter, partial [Hyphomicrobiales bacterium]|nr:cation acetate symporter [Hyphomicrobiales bacterium]